LEHLPTYSEKTSASRSKEKKIGRQTADLTLRTTGKKKHLRNSLIRSGGQRFGPQGGKKVSFPHFSGVSKPEKAFKSNPVSRGVGERRDRGKDGNVMPLARSRGIKNHGKYVRGKTTGRNMGRGLWRGGRLVPTGSWTFLPSKVLGGPSSAQTCTKWAFKRGGGKKNTKEKIIPLVSKIT